MIRDALIAMCVVSALVLTSASAPRAAPAVDVVVAVPSPTIHPPVARDAAHLWMAPSEADRAAAAADPALAHLHGGASLLR